MTKTIYDDELVDRLNKLSVVAALNFMGISWQIDRSYTPATSKGTVRICFRREHDQRVRRNRLPPPSKDFELLVNETKWYDKRMDVGGYGAISFVMHVFGCSFYAAMIRLTKAGVTKRQEPQLPGPVPATAPGLFD